MAGAIGPVLKDLMAKTPGLETQDAVAKAIGISQSQIGRILRDESQPSFGIVAQLAQLFRVPLDQLIRARNEAGGNVIHVVSLPPEQRDGQWARDHMGPVPLISWVRAGAFDQASDPFQPGDADRWIPCPVAHSDNTYALTVRGDSMTSSHGKSYPNGSIIFVDPLRLSPTSGQRIIAKLDGSDEVTFKVYQEDAGVAWLKPLNPEYPLIRQAFRVLGTVIGKWEDE